jgi:hypothetical protein
MKQYYYILINGKKAYTNDNPPAKKIAILTQTINNFKHKTMIF